MSKIEVAKKETNSNTSEYLLGLEPAIDYQCNLIDEIKDKVGSIEILSNVKRKEEDDVEVLRDKLYYIENEVDGLDEDIEKLRTAIGEVRSWGQDWKDLAKKLIERYDIKIEDL